MLHRAILGSVERFLGILIEHTGGDFPLWLAPVQVAMLPVSDKFLEYAEEVAAKLRSGGVRVSVDGRNEKLGAKIRGAELAKVPCMAVIGERERETGSVSPRRRHTGDTGSKSVEEFMAALLEEIASRR